MAKKVMPGYNADIASTAPRVGGNEISIPEMDRDFLSALDTIWDTTEKLQTEGLYQDLNSRGILDSGQTLKDVSEQVLGPSVARRTQAEYGVKSRGAEMAREERMGSVNFERQRQLKAEDFTRRLEELEQEYRNQRNILSLQANLRPSNSSHGFFGDLAEKLPGAVANFIPGAGAAFIQGLLKKGPNDGTSTVPQAVSMPGGYGSSSPSMSSTPTYGPPAADQYIPGFGRNWSLTRE